jgi:hypothetical protein
MNPLDDREKAFEAKFHVDAELEFKANARRDKLLGLWVAEQIGLTGPAAEDYARAVVAIDLDDSRHQAMTNKLLADLSQHQAKAGAAELYAQMDLLTHVARQQIASEAGDGKQTVSPA